MQNNFTPTVLAIAGSDPYGGAGIQVDAKVIHTLGGYAFTVITALTAQNSTGVKDSFSTPSQIFKAQLTSILDDIEVDAVKIGMLVNAEIISIISEAIDKYKLKNIVLDTVLVSSSGKPLLESGSIETMVKELFPRVDLITPNIPEVNTFLSTNYLGNEEDILTMASYLVQKPLNVKAYSTPRISTTHTHGTGCVLSSAVATHLALGYDLMKSVELSKIFLYKSLQTSSSLKFNYKEDKSEKKEPLF